MTATLEGPAVATTDRDHRDSAIARAVVEGGRTLNDVGQEFGLTRERVRQIVMAHDPEFSGRQRQRERRDERRAKQVRRRQQQLEDAAASGRTSVSETGARQQYRYSEEELLQRLRDFAATHEGAAPTTTAWVDEHCSPSVMIYVKRFGSWAEAKRRAGFETTSRGRRSRWSREELVELVLQFLLSEPIGEGQYGAKHYGRWRDENAPEAPSITSLYLVGGSWAELKADAIELGKSRGVL